MLHKGYGLILNYPVPYLPPSGDVDIYFMCQWKKADNLVSTRLGIQIDNSHHHAVYSYKSQSIENHYDFVNVHSLCSAKKIENYFKCFGFAERERGEEIMTNIFIPSLLLDAEYTIRQAAFHFASGEMTMRQMLDCLLLIEKKSSQIGWISFGDDVKWKEIQPFAVSIIEISCRYFGFSRKLFYVSY